ncbi:MAG: DUF5103 domain-containing protein [Bacteroidales bacterium]|nr:DUF5103 domain-containing protein [Bacteroidales bacterium]
MNRKLIIIFSLLLFSWNLFAWDFPNENRVYDPNINTVLLYKDGFEMAMPVIALNSGEKLKLSFDDLDVSLKNYHFTIRHCTADWETTNDLLTTDYIDGMQDDQIDEFDYSYNTTVEYIHYTAFIPSRYLKPRISGNYLLIVYIEGPEAPLITRRFMVVEPTSVSVDARVVRSNEPLESYSKQQIDFTVSMPGFIWSNPSREIKITILQNERWDNAIRNPKPRFVRGSELDFTFDPLLIFNGGNEFRALDMKSLRYQTENIRLIEWDYEYHVYMLEDYSRARKNYTLYRDINGRKLIQNEDYATNSAIEADYAWVHFSIPSSSMIPGGKFYLMGALSDYRIAPPNEMVFDPQAKRYSCTLYLKQGFYDYQYLFVPDGSTVGDVSFFEGNHWETENQYTIFVYWHPLSGLYDQLVAVRDINSRD